MQCCVSRAKNFDLYSVSDVKPLKPFKEGRNNWFTKVTLMAVGRGAEVYFQSLLERGDRCEQGRGSGQGGEGADLRNVRG